MMAMSAPHIYLSSLSFVPQNSPIYQTYTNQCPGRLKVSFNSEAKVEWTAPLVVIDTVSMATTVRFSPDGKNIVCGLWDGTIQVLDSRSGQLVSGPLKGHSKIVSSAEFSPDGGQIVSGSDDNTIRIWDVHSGQLFAGPFEGHSENVSSVGYSPDGKRVASGSWDTTIRVWDLHTQEGKLIVPPLEGHTSRVRWIRFLPDGKSIISGSQDGRIKIWNLDTGTCQVDISIIHQQDDPQDYSGSLYESKSDQAQSYDQYEDVHSSISSMAFSPDGRLVASGSFDCSVRIWNAYTGELVTGPLKGHSSEVCLVEFSPDRCWVASGSLDRTIMVWHVQTGQVVAGPFDDHSGVILSIGFSPDGQRIVSSSYDKTIRVWNTLTGQLSAKGALLAPRHQSDTILLPGQPSQGISPDNGKHIQSCIGK
jgi:WD40 repeat protein